MFFRKIFHLTHFPFAFKLKTGVNHLEGGMGENKVVYLFVKSKKNFYPLLNTYKKVKVIILNAD